MTMSPDRSRPYELDYSTDAGVIARFFNTVYAWMAVGLGVTAVVGYLVSHSHAAMSMLFASRGMYFVIGLVAVGIAWYVQAQAGRLTAGVSTALFMLYAAIMGALISGIYLVYPAQTLGAAFLLTAGTFGAMSIYGFVTKRDLSGLGSFLFMAIIGLLIASLVNFWIANSMLDWIITYAVLGVFIILTAYETQMLKNLAVQLRGQPELATRYAIVGALVLYIAFINLFLAILRIVGDRR